MNVMRTNLPQAKVERQPRTVTRWLFCATRVKSGFSSIGSTSLL
jgi:hypothetical protein